MRPDRPRRFCRLLAAAVGLALLLPALAQATTVTTSAGGTTATLSYKDGPGITTKDERLTIRSTGKVVYDQAVSAKGCFKVCGPGSGHPVQVADLYGDDGEDVVLTLFSGGADCCAIDDVFVPSAAVGSYVLDQHNFGEAGAVLRDIGPKGRPEFVSADPTFYCRFTYCAASALPVEIFKFIGERFVDVTKQHPAQIRADAQKWLRLYSANPKQGFGAIVAWAADEDNLGAAATVRTLLQAQIHDGHLSNAQVSQLESFLKTHHYG